MRGKILMIFLLISLLMLIACKRTPFEPEEPYPDPNSAVFEIMYERVKEVINITAADPTGGSATIFHPTFGGKNSSQWVMIETNKWQSEVLLQFSTTKYIMWLHDPKVEKGYEAIARKIFIRLKGGSGSWTELTCIQKNTQGISGEQTEFIADKTGIKNPCGS